MITLIDTAICNIGKDLLAHMNEKIMIIGHKNPDTDSICAALAYADLKRKVTGENYIAKRAGQISTETEFVLERFGVSPPGYVSDVRTQVKDVNIRKIAPVDAGISLKIGWGTMKDLSVSTLPIVDEHERLKGLITVGDIAHSYMDVYDSHVVGNAKTSFANIADTIDGIIVVGDERAHLNGGKVLIAAANPDVLENYIEKGDVILVGNRYEAQLSAVQMNAACIIVCLGSPVSKSIKLMAEANGCTVIITPHETYTIARLINQSIPIEYFMIKDNIIKFHMDDFIEDIRGIMAKKRHREFPIEDEEGKFVGMISRRSLLDMNQKKLILVDHNERNQAVDGLEEAEIVEIVDHHKLGDLETINPVYFRNQPVGCTCTIIYQMYKEHGVTIEPAYAGLMASAIISDTLMYRSPTCTHIDRMACEELAQIAGISVEEYAMEMFSAGSNLSAKSPEEIFYNDFKKFMSKTADFGVGQITSMNHEELGEIKSKLIPYMNKAFKEHNMQMIFIMLTNILDESTQILFVGSGAKELLEKAFEVKANDDVVMLENVVSRKKQVIPRLMAALQR